MDRIREQATELSNKLHKKLARAADPENAVQMAAYMRNQFAFLGIKSPQRKKIFSAFLKETAIFPSSRKALIAEDMVIMLTKTLWRSKYREMHYCAIDLLDKFAGRQSFSTDPEKLFEHLICTNSWWDSVDILASKLIGEYLKNKAELAECMAKKWMHHHQLWLRRTAIIFQLNYKDKTNADLLSAAIKANLGSKEFFINKAIGWALRSYARHRPEWVIDFVNRHELSNLSKREAMKHLT
jgi:3-methyladenine DNA glycosylase AlkD